MTDRPPDDPDAAIGALKEEIAGLRAELAHLNGHRFVRIHRSPWRLMAWRFGGGLAFGLGTFLGGSLLLSVIAIALGSIDFIPMIGDWAAAIAAEMDASR